MTKVVLTPVTNLSSGSAVGAINTNYTRITTAIENTLSRDGTTPNQMGADIDLNSNDLLNVSTLDVDSIIVNGQLISVDSFTTIPIAFYDRKYQGDYNTEINFELSSIPSVIQYISVAGYYSIGDGGEHTKKRISTPSPVKGWHKQAADGSWWQVDSSTANPRMFGAKGDNSTDDSLAFQIWGDYCGIFSKTAEIKRINSVLGTQLVYTLPFDVECDETSILRWNNSVSQGILLDMRANPSTPFNQKWPALLSSAINSSYNIPGYSPGAGYTYDVSTRLGDAINIKGSSRYTIMIQNAQGWKSVYHPQATYDVTYGTRSVANIDIGVNTVDFCERLFWLDGGPTSAGGIVAFNCYANTAWAKHVLYLDCTNNLIGAGGTVRVNGQVFLNETGAVAIYSVGASAADFDVDMSWVSAGASADSPSGTPTNLVCEYVAGDGTSNSLTTDGGSSLGYFRGNGVRINIGAVMGYPLGVAPYTGGYPSSTNGKIRVKNAGTNIINIKNQDIGTTGSITCTTTQGETNFNGGLGSAVLAKKQLVSITVPTLANFGSAVFYFYHQLLSQSRVVPVLITPLNTGVANSKLSFSAQDRVSADGVNRQIKIQVDNTSGASVTGTTYTFWLDID